MSQQRPHSQGTLSYIALSTCSFTFCAPSQKYHPGGP